MVELKNGATTTDPRLDRIVQFDDASRNFQVRTLLEAHPRTLARKRRHIVALAPTLDQGQEGACSGFGIAHSSASTPFRVKSVTNALARELYFDNQRNDEWPGGEYPGATPQYGGSSVLGSMKTLLQRGWITSYRWIGAGSGKLMDDLHDTLKYVGPVNFGTNWYESMFEPEPNGLLTVDITPTPAGGHAYCVHDWVTKKLPGTAKRADYLVIQNSWGPDWGGQYKGQGGFGYLKVADAEALLTNDGEGAVPIRSLPAKEPA